MHQLSIAADIAGPVLLALLSWVVSRITKARQAETHQTITAATDRMRSEVIDHMDARLETTDRRIEELARSVESIDEREAETRMQLMHLKGRFDEQQAQRAAGA